MHSCIQYIHISLTFNMQNVKEFLFRKEKEFLLIIFTYIFLEIYALNASKANELYRFSKKKKKSRSGYNFIKFFLF